MYTMKNDATNDKEQLEYARDLVRQLEAGDRENANKILATLSKLYESAMFYELCRLTRELHNVMNEIQIDSRVVDMTKHDIPDAKDRLNYVIQLTEQAANKTLTVVEETIPVCEEIESKAKGINDEWKRYVTNESADRDPKELTQKFSLCLKYIINESAKIKANMNDVMIAQDFQDLSGQCIRRVISLVQEIEQTLVNFITHSGHEYKRDESIAEQEKSKPEGPQIPGKEGADAMSSQDDVDDLLSSLGF